MNHEFHGMTRILYAAVSAPAGQRNWEQVRQVFHPAARLVRTGVDEQGSSFVRAMSVEEYVANVEGLLRDVDFSEVELSSEATAFGNVARLASVYEFTRRSGTEQRRGRGVNFFTLVRDDTGWKIMSIVWDNERDGVSLDAAGLAQVPFADSDASPGVGGPAQPPQCRARKLTWDEVPDVIVNASMIRRTVTGERLTVARIKFKNGFRVPLHQHIHEQITQVTAGSMRFWFGADRSEVIDVGPGELVVIPSNLQHEALCIGDVEETDIWTPRREDWLNGTDAYLRQQ